jgi:hypothetical protein
VSRGFRESLCGRPLCENLRQQIEIPSPTDSIAAPLPSEVRLSPFNRDAIEDCRHVQIIGVLVSDRAMTLC